jgi:hypothetical protein
MQEHVGRKRARLGLITGAAAVIAVFFVALSAVALGAAGSAQGTGAAAAPTSGLVPEVTPNTQVYLNQSELSHSLGQLSPYVALYVTFNNSTVHKLPYANTAVATTFFTWVTVNASYEIAKNPRDLLLYQNATTANGTGLHTWSASFVLKAGSAYWLSYVEYQYTDFSFTISAPQFEHVSSGPTATLVNESKPSHSVTWLNTTETFTDGVLALAEPDNWSFYLALPATFTNSTNSPQYGETVTPTYTFSSAVESSPSTKTLKSPTLDIAAADAMGWSNYTVSYTESNATSYSYVGSFFAGTLTFFGYVETFWWAAALVIVLVALVILARADRGRRRGR